MATGDEAGANPSFISASPDPAAQNDFRLRPGGPAIEGGVELPAEWPERGLKSV